MQSSPTRQNLSNQRALTGPVLAAALLALAALVATAPPALAGTVKGTVVYAGPVPNLPTLDMAADPQCAAQHESAVTSPVLVLGDEVSSGDEVRHSLGNVLVQVTGELPKGAAAEGRVVIDQKGCLYVPRVVGVQVGQTLEVRNSDGILHNVHFVPEANEEKNLAMPPFLDKIEVDFAEPEPAFPVKCDIHPWMKAWIAVLEHPFFAVTGSDGSFAIDGLPAGTYTVVAWHERLGTVERQVEVPADGSASVDFVMRR